MKMTIPTTDGRLKAQPSNHRKTSSRCAAHKPTASIPSITVVGGASTRLLNKRQTNVKTPVTGKHEDGPCPHHGATDSDSGTVAGLNNVLTFA